MGTLHSALKPVLILTLTIAPVIADENPFATSDPAAPDASVSDTTSRTKSKGKATAPDLFAAESQQLFFSASGDVTQLQPARGTETKPASQLRKTNTSIRSPKSAVSLGALRPPATPKVVDATFSPAIFEANGEERPELQQVSATEENAPVEPADEEAPLPFQSPELTEAADAITEPQPEPAPADEAVVVEPEFEFNVEQQEPTEIGAPPRELFETPTSDSVVPNTEADSLPAEHTGAQQPSVQVHWIGTDTFNIGQECECTLVVTNTGESLVRNVTVEAAIPTGLRVITAEPAPQQGTSRWSVGDLTPGQSESVAMVMVPEKRGSLALNAFVRFTGFSTSVIEVQEPMLKTAVQGPDSVTVGEQAGYMVRVENPGTGTAHNVVIEAQIPEGMEHRSGTTPRIRVGTLNPGESRQARLNLTAVEGGQRTLTVQATADGGLRDVASSDIAVAKPSLNVVINGPETTAAGEPADYEVTVTNTGNIPSINVRAKYKLPDNSHFVHADRGGVHHESEQLVDWFVGTIQPGESSSYRVTLKAETAGKALHRAGVVSEHTAVTLVSHSTIVEETPELYLDVSTAEPAPNVGDETVIRIIVQNDGSVDAGKVGLSCELPSGLEFIAADGPSEFLAENGIIIFRSLEQIDAGDEAVYLIKARCIRAGGHHVRARVGGPSLTDPVIGEGTVRTRTAR